MIVRRGKLAVIATIVAFTLFGLLDGASAISSGDFTYTSGQTGYYAIDTQDMAPNDGNIVTGFVNRRSGDLGTTASRRGCFGTGIHLPQGAGIQRLVVFYSSTRAISGLEIFLAGTNQQTGAVAVLVSSTATDSTGNRKSKVFSVTGPARTVDNKTHSYRLFICMGGPSNPDHFYGARIDYSYSNAGD